MTAYDGAVTPAQLRAFVTVVRRGSVKEAASELEVTEAAVSGHVAMLRKELDDQLFVRSGSGIAFTPGGLRLATRAVDLLGLQDQTVREVSEAGKGRRLLRMATSSLFAEYAAPGLIELFTSRADDLGVELSVRRPGHFATLLAGRAADVAIGPGLGTPPEGVVQRPFLKYQLVLVAGPGHQLANTRPRPESLREHLWLLGPSVVDESFAGRLLRQLGIPERQQRIFQSHAAAVEEARGGAGVALSPSFAVSKDLAEGRLVQVAGRGTQVEGTWSAMTLPNHSVVATASELLRFITTPRATQAMLRGAGATVGHFRPAVHVTLWS